MENQLNDALPVADVVNEIRAKIAEACESAGRPADSVRLMAVTKTVPAQRVNQAICAGITLLGENKAQELLSKYDAYQRENVEIHFIGHLQTNKVRQIIDKVTMIQSLDSISLAEEIQRQCEKHDLEMDCLVEVNVGGELTKSGVAAENLEDFVRQAAGFSRLHIRGIMAIPPICNTELEQERNFSRLHELFVDIGAKNVDNIAMEILSMGMSSDYLLAIKYGATLVRLGTTLFGRRAYPRPGGMV